MTKRNLVLANNEIYHVFNRSVGHENIFSSKINLNKILEIIEFYRFPQTIKLSKFKTLSEELKSDYFFSFKNSTPFIEIHTYSFMPNHYHFLLKQIQDHGIAKFAANIQNSFAKYFNIKFNRHGALFQNPFKARRVETDEQFIHVSRYIHLNPVTSYLIEFKDLATYPWTSFQYFAQDEKDQLVNTNLLLKMFGSREKYIQFVCDQADYQNKLDLIKYLVIE